MLLTFSRLVRLLLDFDFGLVIGQQLFLFLGLDASLLRYKPRFETARQNNFMFINTPTIHIHNSFSSSAVNFSLFMNFTPPIALATLPS
jgi:hypothetical protein